jgi:hypothetical protein
MKRLLSLLVFFHSLPAIGLLILPLEVCRVLKSLCRDPKEISKPSVFVQPVTLSALSLSEPLRTIHLTITKG